MLERREDVRPAQKLEVSFRGVAADFFQQGLEANHARRCLTPQGWCGPGSSCVRLMIAGATAVHRCWHGIPGRTGQKYGLSPLTGQKTAHYTGALTRAWTAPP